MALGLIFVTGLLTSLHCIAMCGNFLLAFAVTQEGKAVGRLAAVKPMLYYSGAKLISYAGVGMLAGLIGTVLNLGGIKGWVNIVAGTFMVIMALNMLNVHPALRVFSLRMPKFITRRMFKSTESANQFAPALFGLMNGLMPCGPLQAMVLFAAGTGSATAGGLTMLAFGLGTLPLMLSYGTFAALLAKRFKRQVMLVSAMVVIILGLVVLNRGLVLTGFKYNFKYIADSAIGLFVERSSATAKTAKGVQELKLVVDGGYIPDTLVVEPGTPVRLTVERKGSDVCADLIVFAEFGIDKKLKPNGTTIIEFTPKSPGIFPFTCGMGMYQGTIRVGAAAAGNTGALARNRMIALITLAAFLFTLVLKPPDFGRLWEVLKTGDLRAGRQKAAA